MKIEWQELEPATLERLLQEVVTRDGTDYGAVEKSTSTKVDNARKALASGRAQLHWDIEAESATLLTPEEAAAREAESRAEARATSSSTVDAGSNEPG